MKEDKPSFAIRAFANIVAAIVMLALGAYFVVVFGFGTAVPIIGIIAFIAQFFK